MLKEAGVFNRNRGLAHDRCNAVQGDFNPILIIDCCQHGAIGGQDHASFRQRWGVQFLRQGLEIPNKVTGQDTEASGKWDEHEAH